MRPASWADLLTDLVQGRDLDLEAATWAMGEILAGQVSPVQVAGFMVALRAKGETVTEVTGLSDAMLANARHIDLPTNAVDIVGSGGDRANTVNISTMAAMVAAAAGAKVVKHGNRAASSMSGTADCLEALGVVLDLPPQVQRQVFDTAGIVFLFASHYHPSLRFAAVPRRELAISTTFNFLGPLSNPARVEAQAVGVADARMAELMAGVLAGRNNRGMVFHGGDGLDELTTTTNSTVWLFSDGEIVKSELDPRELGIARAQKSDLVGGPPAHNAQVVRDVFAGQTGPVRDIVVLNAAAALLAYDGPTLNEPLLPQLAGAKERVIAAIDDGKALALLNKWVDITQYLATKN